MGDEVMVISLLGAFSVTLGANTVPEDAWRLRKAKTLIKLLALAPEQRLHSEAAADLLWPDRDPVSARNNLHQALFAARRALGTVGLDGHRCLELREDVIALGPGRGASIDAVVFEQAAATARERRDPATYREALAAYHGELLPEDRYEEWSAPRRDALKELRVALGIELALLEADTDSATATGRLRDVIAEEPLHEPAHRALMRIYAGAGQRQEALAQFQELKRGLRREYEDEPDDETRRLYQEILTRSLEPAWDPGPEPEERPTHGDDARRLPQQLTSFIGRDRELAEVSTLLGSSRLLTLTGAGGCGKTRLAIELAGRRTDFPGGIWSVELAALAEPALIGPAIAQEMDARLASDRPPEVALAAHIGERDLLLLLDNCEHLIEPVAQLVESLLRSCPNLTVLATSREPLRVPGEVTWRVPSLSLPQLSGSSVQDRSLQAESMRLFAVRASQVAPDFELDADNAAAVAALCHRLDGMPLAIELAAARVEALSPAQIAERLDDSLDLLSAGSRTAMTRQQTLRATLAWSFDLLEAEERVLLRRLSVFAGSFGLGAAEEICRGEPLRRSEAVALLGRLVDKSLVHVESGSGESRYRLLETVRQYAGEQLKETGEQPTFEQAHRDWYLELCESDPTPAGDLPAQDRLRRLDLERDNLRAALTTAMSADPQTGLRLAASLWRFWLMRGYLAEGYRWLVASLSAAPEHTAARAHVLRAACLLGLRRGVHDRIHEFGGESVAIFAELEDHADMFDSVEVSTAYRAIVCSEEEIEELLGDYEGLEVDGLDNARPPMWAAHTRGIAAWMRQDYPRARERFELALERAGELGTGRPAALWPVSYGLISLESEIGYPLLLHEDTVLVGRRAGREAALAYILANLAAVDRIEGRFDQAGEITEESIARFRQLGDNQGEASSLNAAGNLARTAGDFERGRALLEASLGLRQRIGDRRGSGITLGSLAMLEARSGDPSAGRAAAERARGWFVENDDMVGLSAAEFSLAGVALCDEDRGEARVHLEAAAAILGGMESMHQQGWTLAVLSDLCAEDGDPAAARGWLDQARRHFDRLGSQAGIEYCLQIETKALQRDG
jgi:predicted ATPase/DNA-binding SARP family transcriptional activator